MKHAHTFSTFLLAAMTLIPGIALSSGDAQERIFTFDAADGKWTNEPDLRMGDLIQVRILHPNTFRYKYTVKVEQLSLTNEAPPDLLKPLIGSVRPQAGVGIFSGNAEARIKAFIDAMRAIQELLGLDVVLLQEAYELGAENSGITIAMKTMLEPPESPGIGYTTGDLFKRLETVRDERVKNVVKAYSGLTASDSGVELSWQAVASASFATLVKGIAEGKIDARIRELAFVIPQYLGQPNPLDFRATRATKDVVQITLLIEERKPPILAQPDGPVIVPPGLGQTSSDSASRTYVTYAETTGNMKFDYTIGTFVSNDLRQQNYYLDAGSLIQEGARDDARIKLGALAHIYRRGMLGTNNMNVALSFGVGGTKEPDSYMAGVSLLMGQRRRVALTLGYMWSKLDVLNGDTVGSPPNTAGKIQTSNIFKRGAFLGISFDF